MGMNGKDYFPEHNKHEYTLFYCGECYGKQLKGHREGDRGSHAHAYHLELVDQGCQMEKPAEETTACLACHAIAENRCDGCHTRHRFSAAEAKNPPVAACVIPDLSSTNMRCTCNRITAWSIRAKGRPGTGQNHLMRKIIEKLGIKHTAYPFWKHGEYTDMLLGWKRKEWEK